MVTSIGATGALNVIKRFKKMQDENITLIGADCSSDVAGRFFVDVFYPIPHGSDGDYVDRVIAVCRENEVNILIPIFGNELCQIASRIDEFRQAGVLVPISDLETVELCLDKAKTYRFFRENSIRHPAVYENISKIPKSAFPVFAKPRISLFGGSRECFKITSRQELEKLDPGTFIIQEYIEGEEYSIDTFSDMAGRAIGIVPRKRLEVKNGLATKSITVMDESIISDSWRILERLKIKGPANIQCFKTAESNENIFIEINPRFGGTYIISMEAGLDAPRYLLEMYRSLTPESTVGEFKDGLMMVRYWSEIYYEK